MEIEEAVVVKLGSRGQRERIDHLIYLSLDLANSCMILYRVCIIIWELCTGIYDIQYRWYNILTVIQQT